MLSILSDPIRQKLRRGAAPPNMTGCYLALSTTCKRECGALYIHLVYIHLVYIHLVCGCMGISEVVST